MSSSGGCPCKNKPQNGPVGPKGPVTVSKQLAKPVNVPKKAVTKVAPKKVVNKAGAKVAPKVAPKKPLAVSKSQNVAPVKTVAPKVNLKQIGSKKFKVPAKGSVLELTRQKLEKKFELAKQQLTRNKRRQGVPDSLKVVSARLECCVASLCCDAEVTKCPVTLCFGDDGNPVDVNCIGENDLKYQVLPNSDVNVWYQVCVNETGCKLCAIAQLKIRNNSANSITVNQVGAILHQKKGDDDYELGQDVTGDLNDEILAGQSKDYKICICVDIEDPSALAGSDLSLETKNLDEDLLILIDPSSESDDLFTTCELDIPACENCRGEYELIDEFNGGNITPLFEQNIGGGWGPFTGEPGSNGEIITTTGRCYLYQGTVHVDGTDCECVTVTNLAYLVSDGVLISQAQADPLKLCPIKFHCDLTTTLKCKNNYCICKESNYIPCCDPNRVDGCTHSIGYFGQCNNTHGKGEERRAEIEGILANPNPAFADWVIDGKLIVADENLDIDGICEKLNPPNPPPCEDKLWRQLVAAKLNVLNNVYIIANDPIITLIQQADACLSALPCTTCDDLQTKLEQFNTGEAPIDIDGEDYYGPIHCPDDSPSPRGVKNSQYIDDCCGEIPCNSIVYKLTINRTIDSCKWCVEGDVSITSCPPVTTPPALICDSTEVTVELWAIDNAEVNLCDNPNSEEAKLLDSKTVSAGELLGGIHFDKKCYSFDKLFESGEFVIVIRYNEQVYEYSQQKCEDGTFLCKDKDEGEKVCIPGVCREPFDFSETSDGCDDLPCPLLLSDAIQVWTQENPPSNVTSYVEPFIKLESNNVDHIAVALLNNINNAGSPVNLKEYDFDFPLTLCYYWNLDGVCVDISTTDLNGCFDIKNTVTLKEICDENECGGTKKIEYSVTDSVTLPICNPERPPTPRAVNKVSVNRLATKTGGVKKLPYNPQRAPVRKAAQNKSLEKLQKKAKKVKKAKKLAKKLAKQQGKK